MESIRNRATDLLPSVLLTLLSMIQAIALELLWSRVKEIPELWAFDFTAVLVWTQVVAMFLGLLLVWLFYSSLVMRFRWKPSPHDSIVPFAIGLLEFSLIDLMGPDHVGLWCFVLALVFAMSIWTSQGMFRRARSDPANAEFFATVEPANWRDFTPSIVVIAGLALFGMTVGFTDSRALAFVALLFALAAIVHQVTLSARFWDMSLEE